MAKEGMCGKGDHVGRRGHVGQRGAYMAKGVCVAGGMHSGGDVHCRDGACVAVGHVWLGGMCGSGACMAGGYVWRGACVAGETTTAADSKHPTGTYSCYHIFLA